MADLGEFGAAERAADPDVEPDTFTYYGETFTVKARVGSMPLLKFAAVAQAGVQAEDCEGLAAMHRLITSCIVPDDLGRFEKVASDHDADTDELMSICVVLYKAVTGRPTSRPSASADGSLTTTETAKAPLSSEESLPPIQRDPRVQELKPIADVARELVLVG